MEELFRLEANSIVELYIAAELTGLTCDELRQHADYICIDTTSNIAMPDQAGSALVPLSDYDEYFIDSFFDFTNVNLD